MAREHSTTPGHGRSSAELQREVAAARADLSRTVDAIGEHLSRDRLADQVVAYLSDGVSGRAAERLMRRVSDNPVPAVLAGVGLAWLLLARRREPVEAPAHHHPGVAGEPEPGYPGHVDREPLAEATARDRTEEATTGLHGGHSSAAASRGSAGMAESARTSSPGATSERRADIGAPGMHDSAPLPIVTPDEAPAGEKPPGGLWTGAGEPARTESAGGTEDLGTPVYTLLHEDHEKVKRTLSRILEGDEREQPAREALFSDVVHELEVHTKFEEEEFYPRFRDAQPDAGGMVQDGIKEHDEAKAMLANMAMLDKTSGAFMEKVKELKQALEHHIADEETKMFALARIAIDDAEARAMGRRYQQTKESRPAPVGGAGH